MSARVLSYSLGLFSLLREIQYTLGRTKQEPLTVAHAPTFQAHREEWQTILLTEISLLDGLVNAQAAVDKADHDIDQFAGSVSRAVDEHTDGATRKQLRTALFKGKSLTKFRRPVLGGELEATRNWNETLSNCGIAALAALALEAETFVTAGFAAARQRDEAHRANRTFRDVGARKQFIDKLNASRKELHGVLAQLPFQHPNLPSDFADGFFAMGVVRDEEETIDEVKASIDELRAQLEERMALLQKLEEEAANAAREEEARRANVQAAEDLEAQAKELLAKAAALKAGIKK